MRADQQAKIAKLLTAAKDLHEKQGEILAEIDTLLEGKASIGDRLKAAERAFDVAWCARYAPGQHGRYVWAYVKDRPQWKRLLKVMTVDELAARAARYVQAEDPFFVRNRHAFGLFVSSVNQWAAERSAAPDRELAQPVGDCRHDPRCASDQAHTRRRLAEMCA